MLLLLLLLVEGVGVGMWAWRTNKLPRVRRDLWGLVGLTIISVGMALYILQLAGPTLLPVTGSPDLVHHLSLINFIQQRHSLVHNSFAAAVRLNDYLGEMVVYPAGSHILAALLAAALGVSSLRILHPLLTFLVVLKVGIIYNLILRLLPPTSRNAAIALAGTGLLLVAWVYVLLPFVGKFY